jgi:hypothetical protein
MARCCAPRATPSYYSFNLVRVEDDPGMTVEVEALVAFAGETLAGLDHRRVDLTSGPAGPFVVARRPPSIRVWPQRFFPPGACGGLLGDLAPSGELRPTLPS